MSGLISKNKLISSVALSLLGLVVFVTNVSAVGNRDGLTTLGKNLNLEGNVSVLVGNIIIGVLGLLGVLTLVLIIYAGFEWLISQGDPAKITKAKNIMIYAVIGLAIILTSYGIVHYVIFNGFLGAGGTGTKGEIDSNFTGFGTI